MNKNLESQSIDKLVKQIRAAEQAVLDEIANLIDACGGQVDFTRHPDFADNEDAIRCLQLNIGNVLVFKNTDLVGQRLRHLQMNGDALIELLKLARKSSFTFAEELRNGNKSIENISGYMAHWIKQEFNKSEPLHKFLGLTIEELNEFNASGSITLDGKKYAPKG